MSSLEKVLNDLKKSNYYQALSVDLGANKSALMKSRRAMMKQYHPDRHTGEDKEIANQITSIINTAYEALSDEKFVQKYVQSGYKLRYGVTDELPKAHHQEVVVKRRGKSYHAVLQLTSEQALKGGTFDAMVLETEKPQSVTIPPQSLINSQIIIEGLGEQHESGNSGDLILIIRSASKVKINPLTTLQSIVPFIDSNSLSELDYFGVENIKKGEGLLYIKNSNVTKEGLIIEYK